MINPTFSSTKGTSQCITSLARYEREVAIRMLNTDRGKAKIAMPVRIVESAVRFSESSNCTSFRIKLSTSVLLWTTSGLSMPQTFASSVHNSTSDPQVSLVASSAEGEWRDRFVYPAGMFRR